MEAHCQRYHGTKAAFLEVGEKPSEPKYINQEEFQKDPASVKPIKMHRFWNQPMDLNTGEPLRLKSSLVSSSESSDVEESDSPPEEEKPSSG